MSIKQKFESIDQSQLSENQKEILGKIKTATKDFTITDQKALEKVDGALDNIITKLKATNPQAIKGEAKKREPRAKKEVVKKEPKSETKKPKEAKKEAGGKRTIFSIAKEIRKADESWEDARNRAKKVMETEKKDTTKKMKSETDKLLSFIKRRKELEGLSGTSVKKDSKIEALPKGRRISKKGWKNQHGESEGGKVYYENRDNRTDRLAPNFADKIYLADGGTIVGTPETPLARGLGISYTGLVGETGAMSSGEMFDDGGFIDKYEVDRFKQVMNGKAIAKYIVRVEDSFKNKETYVFGIKLKDQFKGCELAPYENLYGGWSNSGSAFSLDNLQVKKLVPDSFTKIELDEEQTEMLVNKLVKNNIEGVKKFLNSSFFYLNYNQSFEDILKTHFQRSVVKVVSIEFEIMQKYEQGGSTGLPAGAEQQFVNYYLGQGARPSNFEQGGSLVDGYLTDPNFGDFQAGVYANGGEIKTRLSNNFLIVDIDGEKYKSWFPNWLSIDKDYLKKLNEEDKSILIVEKDGSSKNFEVVDRDLMDVWLNDKSAKKPRQVLIEKTKEYHALKNYADGGSTGLPEGTQQHFVNYYLGEGTAQGIFAEGGGIENQYIGKTPSEIWNMYSNSQKMHFLLDHSKEIESTPMSIEKATKTAYRFLPEKIKKSFQKHIREGQYAMGGSLGNHGLKQGDQVLKTMSGGIQKIKTRSGDIVYVNLANGYRGAEPPLPFDDGGEMQGNNIDSELEDFDLDNLDPFETMQYNNFSKSMGKVGALQVLINSVEGDYSQLSEELSELAEKQMSSEDYDEFKDGGFMDSVYAKKGALLSSKERYILELKGLTGLTQDGIEKYISENNLTENEILNIVIGLGRKQIERKDVATAMIGNKNNAESKKLIKFSKSNEALKLADGGSITLTPETPLARGLGISYTGLVGETGAMSSGEMFADGGTIDAFQMRTVRGVDSMPTEILTDEQKVQFAKGGEIVKGQEVGLKFDSEYHKDKLDVFVVEEIKNGNYHLRGKKNGNTYSVPKERIIVYSYATGGGVGKSFRKKRNEYLEKLGQKEGDVWDKIGANSGADIRNSDKLLKAYAEGVEEMLQKEGVGKGSFDQEDYDFYTDENWHLFNEFLVWNRYYEPEMTKTEKAWREKMYEEDMREKRKSNYVANPKIISLSGSSKPKSSNYVAKGKIATITIVKDGKEMVFLPSQVLNGVNLYKGGGKIKNDYVYMAKRYVKEVHYDDGKDLKVVKPSNGYWVKKSALKDSKKEEKMTYEEFLKKRPKSVTGYTYGTDWGGGNAKTVKRTFYYGRSKYVDRVGWFNRDKGKSITDEVAYKLYLEQPSLANGEKFKDGGKTTFNDKATAIAKNFEGKKVKPKYQKEFGKTYDKAEAKEVGKRVAGSQKAKYDSKMAGGGTTKRGGSMVLAKQIRKEGESWASAMKRANEQIKNK
jgi:hypothetical protein